MVNIFLEDDNINVKVAKGKSLRFVATRMVSNVK